MTRGRGCAIGYPSGGRRLAEELLTVRRTFRVDPRDEDVAVAAHRLLGETLARAVAAEVVDALRRDLQAATRSGPLAITDVEVRLWFLDWTLGGRG